jgi:hypothetical protein
MNAPANTKTAVPVAPALKDLLYVYSVTYGALLNQIAITDQAIGTRTKTPMHEIAQNIVARPHDETLETICAYRPTNEEEGRAKAAFLEDFIIAGQLTDDALTALVRSLLPEPVPTVATLFAEWWQLDQHTEPADEAEDDANNDRMRELKRQMWTLPTVTAADLAMKIIADSYHGDANLEDAYRRQLYALAGVDLPRHLRERDEDNVVPEAA